MMSLPSILCSSALQLVPARIWVHGSRDQLPSNQVRVSRGCGPMRADLAQAQRPPEPRPVLPHQLLVAAHQLGSDHRLAGLLDTFPINIV